MQESNFFFIFQQIGYCYLINSVQGDHREKLTEQ